MLEEDSEACDFFRIGNGWLNSSSAITSVLGEVRNEYTAKNTHVRTGQGRGYNRAMSYTREDNHLQRVIHDAAFHLQNAVTAEHCGREPTVAQSMQADFESLSLGHGGPWLDDMDFKI